LELGKYEKSGYNIDMNWFFVALGAPFLYAVVTHVDKYLIHRFKKDETEGRGVGGLILYSALFGLFVSFCIFLFLGTNVAIPLNDIGIMFLVGFSGVAATILYLHAMEKDEASIVAPLFQMIPVFGLILEYFILNIIPSNIQIIGSFIIVIAGILLATEYEGFKIRRIKSSIIFLMLGSSLFFALVSILFKYATSNLEDFWISSFWEYLSWGVIGIILFFVVPVYRKDFMNSLKRDGAMLFGINIAGEIITTVANSLKNFAALLVPVALVYSVEALQPIFVFAFGVLITLFLPKISQEDISRKALLMKGIPIIFMIVGTILILH